MMNSKRLGGTLVTVIMTALVILLVRSFDWEDSSGNFRPVAEKPLPIFRSQLDVSEATDHPDMKFMRQYGHVDGLPSLEQIQTMPGKELHYAYHSYLDNTDYLCRRKIRMGKMGDGGWEVCDDYEFRLIKPCVVYSFGIKNDFSFDDDVGKLYGCKVYSFDPSMNKDSYKRSENVYFYNLGLGGSGGKLPGNTRARATKDHWRVETLSTIKKMLQHQNTTIDIIKMDIEHSEWAAFEDILANGELNNVRQLLVEFHIEGNNVNSMRQRMPIVRRIQDLGFRRFYTHLNHFCGSIGGAYPITRSSCYEVYYVNSRFSRPSPANK